MRRVVLAFRRYALFAEFEVQRWEHNWRLLPPHQQRLIAGEPAKHATARQCIHNNQFFLNSMLQAFDPDGSSAPVPSMLAGANSAADELIAAAAQEGKGQPTGVEVEKVCCQPFASVSAQVMYIA
jgi:hypothetical protein